MERITLEHGSGGRLSWALTRTVFLPELGAAGPDALNDSAVLQLGRLAEPGARLAFTTDTFVVKPTEFPGGDIGRLAVCGTVNDLAAAGARPLWLSAGWVLEEELEIEVLRRLVRSMAATAREAGMRIVTGDTKVVPRGDADGVYVNTAGVGAVPRGRETGATLVRPGDRILVSGTLGDHGMAIMLARQNLRLIANIRSDVQPLQDLVEALFDSTVAVRWLRDATRGGVGAVLTELSEAVGLTVEVEENAVPVRPDVAAAAELLGLDPLFIANEGKMVAVVAEADADRALRVWREHPQGRDARVFGVVTDECRGSRVVVRTPYGTRRMLRLPAGEPLPRIC